MFLVQPVKDLLGLDPRSPMRFSLAVCLVLIYIPNHESSETTSPATAAARREAEGSGAQAEGAETPRLTQGESAVRQATARPCDVAGGRERLEPAEPTELSPPAGLPFSGSGKIRA